MEPESTDDDEEAPVYTADTDGLQFVPEDMKDIFAKFATPEELTTKRVKAEEEEIEKTPEQIAAIKEQKKQERLEAMEAKLAKKEAAHDAGKKLSRRERKLKGRISVAELKQLVERPDVVEIHDCNSHDPKLLIHLKSYRNSVAVPVHWTQKRKYLQGKRGMEKLPFELPQFIADTAIARLRGAQAEKDATNGAAGRSRERMQPKMGKIDIDYQTLHDAFFRYQTKPWMSEHGQLYFEGKEFEVKMREKRPGELSTELARALGMPSREAPPPWLYNMQRYGPPPSYPNLKIPGVNHPIPPGARYGYNESEWGKPPVDEYGRPLFGDVFGTEMRFGQDEPAQFDKVLWGQMAEEEDDEAVADQPEPEDEEEEEDQSSLIQMQRERDRDEDAMEDVEIAKQKSGIESVSSVSTGIETPDALQLRKGKGDGTGTETPDTVAPPRQLYQVLEEKKIAVGSNSLFGASHTYAIPPAGSAGAVPMLDGKSAKRSHGEVELSLNADDLASGKVDDQMLKRKYDEMQKADAQARMAGKEDVSDVVAEQARKKRKTDSKSKQSKFKF